MKKERPKSVVLEWARRLYFEQLTPSGRAIFWILVLSTMVGLYSFQYKIFLVFAIAVSIFSISLIYGEIFSWVLPPRLEITHSPPSRSTCGHTVGFKVSLRNLTKKEYFDLSVREHKLPPEIRDSPEKRGYLGSLPPKEDREVELSLEFTKRGHYVLPGILVESSFPFGISKGRRFFRGEKSLLVYPHFHPLKSLQIPVGKRYQPGGIALTSNLGESTEFISTREFRTGDSLRNIHWRSWARTGKPVVREFQEEYFCRIALVLDTYVPPGSKEVKFNCLESAISISAAIADNLSKQEYIIDIFAAGPDVYHLQAGRSLAYLENILDILACLEHCTLPPFERLAPVMLDNLAQITTCIVVLLDWDESRERLVRTIYSLGTEVKVIIVRDDTPSVDPTPYEDLVGRITRITPNEERKGVEKI